MEEVAIAIVFAVTGWMLKTWLTHQERMKELSVDREGSGRRNSGRLAWSMSIS
ncbi:MAG: hypothetical protein ACYC2G_06625 [Gemmatimonadaceae bacterium]